MRGYAAIGLVNPKTNINVGSVLRAAHCYGAAFVAASGHRYSAAQTDTQKAHRHIPMLHNLNNVFDCIPFDCVPVAVDLIDGAENIFSFKHPERAYYIFGPEDGTLGHKVTDRCKHIIYVPTKYCMNLAATVNVILYDRNFKMES